MKRATRAAVTVHVAASREGVDALVSDVTRMGEWRPETHHCRWVATEGPRPGARFKGYLAGLEADAEAQADAAPPAHDAAHATNASER